jgi:hypothetical protein
MLQLSNEMKGVQQQPQKVGDDVAVLHKNFVEFGVHVQNELRSNAKNHMELRSKIQAMDDTMQELTKKQEATALKEIQEWEMKQDLVNIKKDTAEMDQMGYWLPGSRSHWLG